jgi:hypothetical protein
MNRRTFLRRGVLGGALLALGGGALAAWPSGFVASPIRALRALDGRGFQVLVAVARRIVTVPGADGIEIAHRVDETLAYAPVEVRTDFGKLLGLLEAALPGAILDLRLGPFTRLSPASQDAVLRRWRESSLTLRRAGFQALRKLCVGAHYGDPASWAAIDYPPPPAVRRGMLDDSMAGTPAWLADEARAAESERIP